MGGADKGSQPLLECSGEITKQVAGAHSEGRRYGPHSSMKAADFGDVLSRDLPGGQLAPFAVVPIVSTGPYLESLKELA